MGYQFDRDRPHHFAAKLFAVTSQMDIDTLEAIGLAMTAGSRPVQQED